jgi:hypothetical protein
MFVLIGAGHGVGPLLLIEIASLVNHNAFAERLSLSLHDSYDHLLLSAALIAGLGQIIMVIAMILKPRKVKVALLLPATILMYVGVLYLALNMLTDSASMMSFVTAIPFFILSIILLVKIVTVPYTASPNES